MLRVPRFIRIKRPRDESGHAPPVTGGPPAGAVASSAEPLPPPPAWSRRGRPEHRPPVRARPRALGRAALPPRSTPARQPRTVRAGSRLTGRIEGLKSPAGTQGAEGPQGLSADTQCHYVVRELGAEIPRGDGVGGPRRLSADRPLSLSLRRPSHNSPSAQSTTRNPSSHRIACGLFWWRVRKLYTPVPIPRRAEAARARWSPGHCLPGRLFLDDRAGLFILMKRGTRSND